MSEADAEIVFKARIDADDFNKEIESLQSRLKSKQSQIENLKKAYSNLASGKEKPQEQIRLEKKLNDLLERRQDIQDRISSKGKVKKSDEIVKELNDINRTVPKVQNALDRIKIKPTSAQSVRDLAREINIAEKEAIKLGNALQQSVDKLSSTQLKQAQNATKLENDVAKMQIATQNKMAIDKNRAESAAAISRERIQARMAMNAQNIASREAMFETRMAERKEKEKTRIAEREARERQRIAEREAKAQEKAAREADKISKQRAKAFSSAFGGAFKGLLSPITSVIGKIIEFGKRILRLGTYVLVFSLIRAGFTQLKDYILGALGTNDEFVKSLNQIKSNLMVAFYPIYQYILPAINALMQTLVKASAYFAQFISMLSGKDISESQAGAKALYEQTQAAKDNTNANNENSKSIKEERAAFDKFGKSVKGSKNELASFDKFITLSQNKEKAPKEKKSKDNFQFMPTVSYDENYDNILKFWDGLKKVVGDVAAAYDVMKDKAIELGNAFSSGFDTGFVDNDLDTLNTKIGQIGEHLKEIFNNPEIQTNANNAMLALSESLGAVTGLLASVGVTLAKALIGGFEKFLAENKEQIIKDLNTFFNVTIDFSNFITQFSNAAADIFSVFGGEAAQQIVSDSLTILYDIFVRWGLLLVRFFSDLVIQIFKPFITHKDEIKKALEGTLEGISSAMSGIKTIINGITDFLEHTYNVAIKPILEELGNIWDDTFGIIVDTWNKYVNPVIKKAGELIKDFAEKHITPLIDACKELVKAWADYFIPVLKKVWEIAKPFVRWIIESFVAQIMNGVNWFITNFMSGLENVVTFFKGIIQILTGYFEIISGIFTGKWDKVWSGAGKILKGFGNVFISVINGVITAINAMTSAITTGINNVIDSVNAFHFDLPDWMGGGKFGLNVPRVPEGFAQIPKIEPLAQGAVLKGGSPMLAWLNDQPKGQVNIETPLNTMLEAFKGALSSQEAQFNNNVTIQANGDLNSIISLLDFKIKQNTHRVGSNLVTGDVWI